MRTARRKQISATNLRQEIYSILDDVLRTGTPVEIVRKGKRLKIVPQETPSKLDRLAKRDCLVGDPESIVHMDWFSEWSEGR